ncbi:E3 ubiquitin-protein ligase RMA3 [Hirschfeldia incana]|nr:E3 ubiquitin-protein ligase RMA3 [Hirschfeldia incana]
MEGNFFMSESDTQQAHDDTFLAKQKPNLVTGQNANENGCFDCNICLDTAHDPVVTLCGHLFCWPCIYKWLHVQLSSVSTAQNHNNCPVCKSNIAVTSLVPLYGRGMSSTFDSNKQDAAESTLIPRRPSPSTLYSPITSEPRLQHHQTMSPTFHRHNQYSPRGFTTTESTDLANAVMMSFLYPVIGMFGDLVYTRIFGTFTNAIAQPYQSQRMMQREKSLNRVSIFFFFCIILCLLLF